MITVMKASVAAGQLQQFFDQYPRFLYPQGKVLVHSGEEPAGIYFLESGLVALRSVSDQGQEMTFSFFKPFSFFPMMWAFNRRQNWFDLVAVEAVSVRLAPVDDVLDFLKRNPDILMDLTKRVFSGLEGLLKQMQYTMSADAKTRIGNILCILADRFGVKSQELTKIDLPITHSQLASLAGVSRETVTREMNSLKKNGWLKVIDHQIYIDQKKILSRLVVVD